MSENAINQSVTFAQLPVGTRFCWRSNLGAGDAMRKVSETHVHNLVTNNTVPLSASIFGPNDPVRISPSEHDAGRPERPLDLTKLGVTPASWLLFRSDTQPVAVFRFQDRFACCDIDKATKKLRMDCVKWADACDFSHEEIAEMETVEDGRAMIVMGLPAAERFFYENTAYSFDPLKETPHDAKLKAAYSLAAAERDAAELVLSAEWLQEDERMSATCESVSPGSDADHHSAYVEIVRENFGGPRESFASLGSVDVDLDKFEHEDKNNAFVRVLVAELYEEAIEVLDIQGDRELLALRERQRAAVTAQRQAPAAAAAPTQEAAYRVRVVPETLTDGSIAHNVVLHDVQGGVTMVFSPTTPQKAAWMATEIGRAIEGATSASVEVVGGLF